MEKTLTIATCQHAVSPNVGKNLKAIKKQVKIAYERGADIVHFSECNLSSYAGIDFKKYDPEREQQIENGIAEICKLAGKFKIWIIFGTHFFKNGAKKPFNSLFVVNNTGDIEIRYDKRLLSEFDLDWYKAGSEPGIFHINGVDCGLLICHEWRYPELYREYHHLGVELVFESWYDGNYSDEDYENQGKNLGEVIPGFVRGNAANNKLWISGANTSKKESSFPAFVTQPDGGIFGKLKRNVPGVLISKIDYEQKFSDLSGHLRSKVRGMIKY